MRTAKSIFIVFLLLIAANSAYSQRASCTVSGYINDLKTKTSSSTFVLGQFLINPNEDEVVKYFSDKESGVNVSAGVLKVTSSFESTPNTIKLRISFLGKPDDSFAMLEGAEAESIYDKNWKALTISDKIRVDNQVYSFSLSCRREK